MTVTVIALALTLWVPGAAALGGPWPALVLVLLAALASAADGAVAILTSRTTRLGYLYDSLVARVAEVCWLTAFWVLGAPVWLLVICGAVAWLHEYVRARAAAVGLTDVGSMTVGEWTTRLAVTAAGLLLAGVASRLTAGTVTVAAVVWVFLGGFGLAQLLSGVRKSLQG